MLCSLMLGMHTPQFLRWFFCLVAKKLLVKKCEVKQRNKRKKSINSDNSKNETIVPQLCHLFPYLALNELL